MDWAKPTSLRIPALGIDTSIVSLSLADGVMETPREPSIAGWYEGSPAPGELGPAVITAHYDWYDGPGLFYNLYQANLGDKIYVTRDDGSEAVFEVSAVEQHDREQIPNEAIYGNIDHAGLRLITCAGYFQKDSMTYTDNLIVYAHLVE